jgi:hypothetical protein
MGGTDTDTGEEQPPYDRERVGRGGKRAERDKRGQKGNRGGDGNRSGRKNASSNTTSSKQQPGIHHPAVSLLQHCDPPSLLPRTRPSVSCNAHERRENRERDKTRHRC